MQKRCLNLWNPFRFCRQWTIDNVLFAVLLFHQVPSQDKILELWQHVCGGGNKQWICISRRPLLCTVYFVNAQHKKKQIKTMIKIN